MRTLLLVLALGAAPARAEVPEVAPSATAPVAVRQILPDGDRLVVVEDRRAPVVVVRLAFPLGTASAWARRQDAAFAWSRQLDDADRALRARADALAVQVDLWSDPGAAWLQLTCLRDDLPEALALVRDLLANDALDRGERRRAALAQRIGWRTGSKDPHVRLDRAVRQALYPDDHPVRDGADGPPRHRRGVAALVRTRDVIARAPGRVIGLAGDVSVEEVLPLLDSLLPPSEPPPADAAPDWGGPLPPEDRRERTVSLHRLTQVTLGFAREGLKLDDPHAAELLVATHVLGGHFYSRLTRALRHDGGQTYAAHAVWRQGMVSQPYLITTSTRAENAATAEATVRETLRRFMAEGLTQEELDDARGWLEGRDRFTAQGPGAALGRAMFEAVWGLPPGAVDQLRRRAAALTLDEVNGFVRSFFDPDAFVVVRVRPRGAGKR